MNTQPNPRHVLHGLDARQKLLDGAKMLAKAVAVTYGPHGKIVLLDRAAGLLGTKDGVTVAREVVLADPVENMGAQILKEACIKVNDDVGDGTTTAAILSGALMEEGHKVIAAGLDAMQVIAGIRAAADLADEMISAHVMRAESQHVLERIAMISSNGDEAVSTKMAEACMAVGKDGTIAIEDGRSVGIDLVFKEGMELDRGALSPVFLDGEVERVLEAPLVACIGATLRTVEDIQDLLEVASQWPDNPLLVLAEGVEGDALKMMVINDNQKVMRCVAVMAPGFHDRKKDFLKDIAALTAATYIDPTLGTHYTKWDPEWFGSLRKATIRDRSSVLIAYDETRELIDERIAEIRADLRQASSEYDRDRLRERIAKLSGGLCIMQVGGYTETEMRERRARIEDALGAVRAALESGVVPGAGTTYLQASEAILAMLDQVKAEHSPDFVAGWRAMGLALQKPLKVLAENAGKNGDVVVNDVLRERATSGDAWVGWDASAGTIRHLGEEPAIIDPLHVTRATIQAASSATSTLLTAEASLGFGTRA